jgi:hypothetical protein
VLPVQEMEGACDLELDAGHLAEILVLESCLGEVAEDMVDLFLRNAGQNVV